MKSILPFLLALALSTAVANDFDHGSYQTATLADATSNLGIDPRADYWFDASHPKYRTRARFTGRTRQIDPGVHDFVSRWVKAMGHPVEFVQMFRVEVEIEQAGAKYWMPLQESLVEPWEIDMSGPGDADLSLLLMGAYDHVPVFTIASFSAVRPN